MILKCDLLQGLLTNARTADPLAIVPMPSKIAALDNGAASIDLRLGTWFLSLRPTRMVALEFDGFPTSNQLTKDHYVAYGDDYVLHPGGFVLGATLEWLRVPSTLAAYVIGKSSLGRRGLIIATATGVHPGFKGCLTLELSNVGEIPIRLKPGMEICQLFFHSVDTGDRKKVDQSQFVGKRKPILGKVALDSVASRLASAAKSD